MWKKQTSHSSINQVRKTIILFAYQNYEINNYEIQRRIYQVPWGFLRPTLYMERTHKTH